MTTTTPLLPQSIATNVSQAVLETELGNIETLLNPGNPLAPLTQVAALRCLKNLRKEFTTPPADLFQRLIEKVGSGAGKYLGGGGAATFIATALVCIFMGHFAPAAITVLIVSGALCSGGTALDLLCECLVKAREDSNPQRAQLIQQNKEFLARIDNAIAQIAPHDGQ